MERKAFIFRMNEITREKLERLANVKDSTMAEAIRRSIDECYKSEVVNVREVKR